jgi:predicted Zn-dependent protease
MSRNTAIQPMTRTLSQSFRAAIAVAAVLVTSGCAISQANEIEMGAQYAAQVEKELVLVNDPDAIGYINLLGQTLVRVGDTRGLTWHFSIVNSNDLNAFAIPGGYIYINRGIIAKASNLAEVAGVLGHEIGHVTRRHGVKQMEKARGASLGVNIGCALTNACNSQAAQAGIGLAAGGIFAKFSRDDEAEADQEGVKTLVAAKIDPNGMPEMFQLLLDERKTRPDAVGQFFASHPMEESRIAATKAAIVALPAASMQGVKKDDQAFQTFKRRLAALPAPPPAKK